ncbi:zinc-binding dehydrogenase [Nocardia miyunensis]|uniref:zinc-binding dehydrogenase n=1 Tax=Nocardia miyunensis TaxID=282684 RepID=UPI000831F462|nr:zinc-binding dehydrogenase [Nocardia miyunensis]
MWAQILTAPARFEEAEVPAPSAADLAEGEVLLRTLAGGICGSDLPYFRGQLPLPWGGAAPSPAMAGAPGFPLHEIVGEVVASKSAALAVGERVVGWASEDNGIAEYVESAASGLAAYDPALAPNVAVMLQPLACVLEAVQRIPSVSGRDVAVLGLGPMGLLFGHAARAMGARSVRGVDRVARDDIAADFGFDETIHATSDVWSANLDDADRPDIVIEAVGHQQSTLGHAANALAPEGVLYYFGIPDDLNYTIPFQTLVRKDLTLMAGTTIRKQAALSAANEYFAKFPDLADRYITHHFAPSDADRAYSMAVAPSAGRAKIVLDMV